MKKIVWDLVIIIYIMLAIFVTVCLLSYNDYNVTEFGDKLLVIVDSNSGSDYNKNDLVIVDKNGSYKKGDNVFYYVEKFRNYYISYGKIDKINKNTVVIGGEIINKDLVIANDKKVNKFSFVGGVLALLESRWGYLGIIILPILLAFIYEIYEIIKEIKKKK